MNYVKHASIKRIGPVVWPGALGLIVLIGLAPGTARAEDDQSGIWNLDKKVIYEVLRSFGMTPKRTLEDQIDYHEHPPLVVPPSRVLPAPQTTSAVRDPNWPVEADVGREAAKKRTANHQDFDPDQFSNPLRPSDLAGSAAAVPSGSAGAAGMTDTMPPSQLGSPGGLFGSLFGGSNGGNNAQQPPQQQQVGTAAAEPPPRTRLIDPPPGYQTPSPN